MKIDPIPTFGTILAIHERRETPPPRVLGNLVSLDGTHAIVASRVNAAEPSDQWSIGHLVTVVHHTSRLIGVVCELNVVNSEWDETGVNVAHIKMELIGEITDDDAGKATFRRGVRSYPALGAIAHRIRATDLEAIYSFDNGQGVEIGRLSQNESIPATVDIDELLSRHFAVVGATGVGKTTAASMLVAQSLRRRPRLRALILDPHNEYRSYFADNSVVLDADNLQLPFWMFRFDEIVDIIYSGRKPNSDEIEALFDLIKSAKMKFAAMQSLPAVQSAVRRPTAPNGGNITADTPVPYRMAEAIQLLDEWMGKLDPRYSRSDLRILKDRLEALSRDPRFRFMFGTIVTEDSMSQILSRIFRSPIDGMPVCIVQLAGLPNEVVNSVVSILARLAFEVAMWSGGNFEIALVCEEAHRYIPSDHSLGFAPARHAIGRIAKEGRKYGACLGIVSQRPSELDPTVLSQCSTMFTMRLSNENDKAIIRSALAESSASTISFLSSIANREAIAFGEAIATPMRMKFGDCNRRSAANMTVVTEPPAAARGEEHDLRRVICRLRGEAVGGSI